MIPVRVSGLLRSAAPLNDVIQMFGRERVSECGPHRLARDSGDSGELTRDDAVSLLEHTPEIHVPGMAPPGDTRTPDGLLGGGEMGEVRADEYGVPYQIASAQCTAPGRSDTGSKQVRKSLLTRDLLV